MVERKVAGAKRVNVLCFWDALAEAKKDPNFKKEINAFIRASMSVYKLQ